MLYKLLSYLNLDLDDIFEEFVNLNLDAANSQCDMCLERYKTLYTSNFPESGENSWKYFLVGKLITRSNIHNSININMIKAVFPRENLLELRFETKSIAYSFLEVFKKERADRLLAEYTKSLAPDTFSSISDRSIQEFMLLQYAKYLSSNENSLKDLLDKFKSVLDKRSRGKFLLEFLKASLNGKGSEYGKEYLNQFRECFFHDNRLINQAKIRLFNLLFQPEVDIPFDVYHAFEPNLLKTFTHPKIRLSGYIITHSVIESDRMDYFRDILKSIKSQSKELFTKEDSHSKTPIELIFKHQRGEMLSELLKYMSNQEDFDLLNVMKDTILSSDKNIKFFLDIVTRLENKDVEKSFYSILSVDQLTTCVQVCPEIRISDSFQQTVKTLLLSKIDEDQKSLFSDYLIQFRLPVTFLEKFKEALEVKDPIYTIIIDRYIHLSQNSRYRIFRDENGVFHKPSFNKNFNEITEYKDDGNHILLSQVNDFIKAFLMYRVDTQGSFVDDKTLFICAIDLVSPIEVVLNTQGNNGSCLSVRSALQLLTSDNPDNPDNDPFTREVIDFLNPYFTLPNEYLDFIYSYEGIYKEFELMIGEAAENTRIVKVTQI